MSDVGQPAELLHGSRRARPTHRQVRVDRLLDHLLERHALAAPAAARADESEVQDVGEQRGPVLVLLGKGGC